MEENWTDGAGYERYIGRWSRLVAREFVDGLKVPHGRRWLDVGCGVGALTQTILRSASPNAVVGIDRSANYARYAHELTPNERARFATGDAQALPVATGSQDVVVSGLVLNFIPSPEMAVAEMARVTRPGGTIGAYVWDYADGMQLMRHFWEAAAALDQTAENLDEGRRFPLCQPGPLGALFRAAGLAGVETGSITIPTVFTDFDDYWTPFLLGQGPAPSYVLSLDDKRRAALRETLRAGLSISRDGSISLLARAWTVQGTR